MPTMSWPPSSNSNTPCVSFIGIVDFSQEARWLYMTDSVTDLLGFEPKELIGRPSLELVHPDEFPRVRQLHYDTIQLDKAAALVYLRLRHKDPYKGYILCGISRTVVHNVLVGSVSFASPGAKALHNASTAQEITVISQGAANFEFRVCPLYPSFPQRGLNGQRFLRTFGQRWHDPSPMPPSPTLAPAKLPPSPSTSSSSSWGSPSPPIAPATVPTISNIRSEAQPQPQYNDEDFEPERSPSPITGRPRPRRRINRDLRSQNTPSSYTTIASSRQPPYSPTLTSASASSGYQRTPSPTNGDRRRRPTESPPSLRRGLSDSGASASSPGRSLSPESVASPTVYDRSSVERSDARARSYSQSTNENGNGSGHTNGNRNGNGGYGRQEQPQQHQNGGRRDPSESNSRSSPPSGYTYPAAAPEPSPAARDTVITFDHLPNKSFRTAFILDRFSLNCTVLYCSNDLLVESTHAIGRNFFDFVAVKDEGIVRSWIECVKGWGVNERGQPSDGGFGFGRFSLLVGGRESAPRLPDPPSRHRQGSTTSRGANARGSRQHNHREHYYSNGTRSISGSGLTPAYYQQRLVEYGEQFPVDAIFSAHSDGLMVILRRAQ